jgi:hypothetical protein
MKKSKAKSKNGHGGARPGAGRRWRWKHQPVKMVRVPVAFLDKILEVADYMDQNDGRLPFSQASEDLIIISGHPSESLSGEELKELAAKRKTQKLVTKVMAGDEEVLVSDATFKELYELPGSLWDEPQNL